MNSSYSSTYVIGPPLQSMLSFISKLIFYFSIHFIFFMLDNAHFNIISYHFPSLAVLRALNEIMYIKQKKNPTQNSVKKQNIF